MLHNKSYFLDDYTVLNNKVLQYHVLQFWADVFSKLDDYRNKHLVVLCKVQFINKETRTLAEMRKINISDYEHFTIFLQNRLSILNDYFVGNNRSYPHLMII